jgi:hypothetical protein
MIASGNIYPRVNPRPAISAPVSRRNIQIFMRLKFLARSVPSGSEAGL